jgi:GH25 family lysozyme M1 (1,4-beta-N-acetylmuramidase)
MRALISARVCLNSPGPFEPLRALMNSAALGITAIIWLLKCISPVTAGVSDVPCPGDGRETLFVDKDIFCSRIVDYQPLDIQHDRRIVDAIDPSQKGKIRSIAIIVTIGHYEQLKTKNPTTGEDEPADLQSAKADHTALLQFFRDQQFDEIIDLHDQYATREYIEFFLGSYLTHHGKLFSNEKRIVVAISAHGAPKTIVPGGGIYLYNAEKEDDTTNIFRLGSLSEQIGAVTGSSSAFQILLLLNSCYGGSLGSEFEPSGAPVLAVEKYGAHALTAGDVDNLVYSEADPVNGSILFSRLIDDVSHRASTVDSGSADLLTIGVNGTISQSGVGVVRLLPLWLSLNDHLSHINRVLEVEGKAKQYSEARLFTLGKEPSHGAFFFLGDRPTIYFGDRPSVLREPVVTNPEATGIPGRPDTKIFRQPESYSINGIDVSSNNGHVVWDAVRSGAFRFAYIRAVGFEKEDLAFRENWDGAGRAGLDRGAVFPVSYCETDTEQEARLRHVLELTEDHPLSLDGTNTFRLRLGKELPLAIDVEWSAHLDRLRLYQPEMLCAMRMDRAEISRRVRFTVDAYRRLSGRLPIVYGNSDVYGAIVANEEEAGSYSVWYADYKIGKRDNIHLKGKKNWTMWQHTDRANVAGVGTPVSRDVFFGNGESYEEFKRGRVDIATGLVLPAAAERR